MKLTVLVASALSANAFVLPGPAVAPVRMNGLVMNEEPQMKPAPTSGWSLTMAGGQRTVEDVMKAQKKAAKSQSGKDGECDIKRYEKGWTTK